MKRIRKSLASAAIFAGAITAMLWGSTTVFLFAKGYVGIQNGVDPEILWTTPLYLFAGSTVICAASDIFIK